MIGLSTAAGHNRKVIVKYVAQHTPRTRLKTHSKLSQTHNFTCADTQNLIEHQDSHILRNYHSEEQTYGYID